MYANIKTQQQADVLHKPAAGILTAIGVTYNPTETELWKYHMEQGWRRVTKIGEPDAGCRATTVRAVETGPETCELRVMAQVNIAEEAAAAEKASADAAAETAKQLVDGVAVSLVVRTVVALMNERCRIEPPITAEDVRAEVEKQVNAGALITK